MARDPAKHAINQKIAKMTAKLESLRDHVMDALGSRSLPSLHAVLGGKNATFIDIKTRVLTTPEAFWNAWLVGMEKYIDERGGYDSTYSPLVELICTDDKVHRYVRTFLKRTFLRYADALSKLRPNDSAAEIWMGHNAADYGLLVTPRFVNGDWENDKSEIRHFKRPYFTISHVLETGLVIPGRDKTQRFNDVDQYLTFFENTIVRAARSSHQDAIAARYVAHVNASADPESVPLLLPEVRFNRERAHKYRLDFMVVEPEHMMRVGFELSPHSTHAAVKGTKGMSQTAINSAIKKNREMELGKARDYFFERGISTVAFADADLANHDRVFERIAEFLGEPGEPEEQEATILARLRRRSSGS